MEKQNGPYILLWRVWSAGANPGSRLRNRDEAVIGSLIVVLERGDPVNDFHVGDAARAVAERARLDARRNQCAIGGLTRREVGSVLPHVRIRKGADVAARANRRIRRDHGIVERRCGIGAGIDGRPMNDGGIDGIIRIGQMTAFTIVELPRVGDVEHVRAVTEAADGIGYARRARGMDQMHHALEIDRCIVGAEIGETLPAALSDVGRVRIVTGDANARIVGAVVAMQRKLVMAIVAFLDVDDLAARHRRLKVPKR